MARSPYSLPCRSDGEVADLPRFAGDALLARLVAELFDGHVVEALHHLLLNLVPDGPQHLHADLRAVGLGRRIGRALQLAHDADDLADGNSPALPRQAVAALGAALAS